MSRIRVLLAAPLLALSVLSGCTAVPPLADGRSLLFMIERETAERKAFDRQVAQFLNGQEKRARPKATTAPVGSK